MPSDSPSPKPGPDLERAIAEHPLLGLLEPASLATVVRTGRWVTYRGGRLVLREGDPPEAFCLLTGTARVFVRSQDKELLLALLRSPAIGGDMEAFSRRPFLTGLRTMEPTQILHIRPDVFEQAVRKSPRFAAALVADLSSRLAIATSTARALAFHPAESRLADLLLDYVRLCGVREPAGIRLTLPLSQASMARDLALSRKSLVRGLFRLRQAGTVLKDRGRYLVLDLPALEKQSSGGYTLSYAGRGSLQLRTGEPVLPSQAPEEGRPLPGALSKTDARATEGSDDPAPPESPQARVGADGPPAH